MQPLSRLSILLIFLAALALYLVLAGGSARDRIVARMPVLEVILINVVALFAQAPGLRFWLDPVTPVFGDFAASSPVRIGLHIAIELWPSWLALAMLRRGPPGDPRLRLVLAVWTIVTTTWMLAGPAVMSVSQFDARSPASLVSSIVASLLAVHVGLALLGLLRLANADVFPGKGDAPDSVRFYAGRVYVGSMHWLMALLLGIAAFALMRRMAGALDAGAWTSGSMQVYASLAAVVIGAMLMPPPVATPNEARADPAPDEAREGRALARFWEQRHQFIFAAVALGVLLFGNFVRSGAGEQLVGGESSFGLVFQLIGFCAGAVLIYVAMGFLVIVLEGSSSAPHDWKRLRFRGTVAGLLALALYLYVTLPRPHADHEISDAAPVKNGRVYVKMETDPRTDSAPRKVLYLEWGGSRKVLCDRMRDETLQSFHVSPSQQVECRWRSEWAKVEYPDIVYTMRKAPPELTGLEDRRAFASLLVRDGTVTAVRMQPVAPEASPCRLRTERALALVCSGHALTLDPQVMMPFTDRWQTAYQWRERPEAPDAYLIDTPAGQYWCGILQAYTGMDGEARDWIDAIVVAPSDAQAGARAFWGINADRGASCEDLWWWRQGQPALAFYYGNDQGNERWAPLPSSARLAGLLGKLVSATPAPPANVDEPTIQEDSSTTRLSMRPVTRDESPCRLRGEDVPAILCNGREILLDKKRTGFPNQWWSLAFEFRERADAEAGFVLDTPVGEYWCGHAQAHTGMRGELPRWTDVILVVPVPAPPRVRPFWGITAGRNARCQDLAWNKTPPKGVAQGVKFHYGKVDGEEKWLTVPPEDPFFAPVPMRKVARSASPCRLNTEGSPALICNGRDITLIRYVSQPNPQWEPAYKWQETAAPGDEFIVETATGDYWCGRLQAFTAPRGEPRAWTDVIVVAPADPKLPGRVAWAINSERKARCEDLQRSQGILMFPYDSDHYFGMSR